MKFVCDRCGKRYTSADSPAPGHVYSIPCKACGNRITVKGAETGAPGGGPWPDEPSRRRRAAPDAAAGESTPTPTPRRPAARSVTPAPSPALKGPPPVISRAPVPEEPAPEIRDDPFAAAALAQKRAAAVPHIDPFADMPELSSDAGAGPLTDVPDIRGPIPETASPPTPSPASFNVRAAQHGLLIDDAKAKELARVEVTPSRSLADVLEPPQEAAGGNEESISFSDQLPIGKLETVPTARPVMTAARPPAPRPRASRSRILPIALVAVAVVAVAGGGGYYYVTFIQGPERARPVQPAPPPPPAATPPAAPTPPATTTEAPAPPPTTTVTPPPPPTAPVAEAPTPPAAAPSRAEPPPSRLSRAEQRRRAREERRAEQAARAAPSIQARVEVEKEAPPAPKRAEPTRPAPTAEPGKPAGGDQSLLDLLGKKQDAPTGASPPRAAGGLGLQKSEVKAVISRSRKSFDACVEEWMRKEPGLDVTGIRVSLIITINPSGVVTAPVVDNPDIDRTTLGACLKSTARKMVFPSFSGDSFEASVPLVLGKSE